MSLNELLPKAVRLYPEKEAVVCGGLRMDYQSFARRVWQLSHALMDLGIRKNDRIAIVHENTHEFLETYLASAHLGSILVPLNHRLSTKELTMILEDSQSRILISQSTFLDKVKDIPGRLPGIENIIWTRLDPKSSFPEGLEYESLIREHSDEPPPWQDIRDDDVAHLYYTSGTTGRPKGVMLTHKNVKSHALGAVAEFQLTDSDHWFHVAPLFHLADAWATFAITWAGGKHVLVPSFEPLKVLRLIE
ncbi:MAG: AMP-binding protein, partial [Thermodesulfobacteriota bacterium]